jgi:hypothetical protein
MFRKSKIIGIFVLLILWAWPVAAATPIVISFTGTTAAFTANGITHPSHSETFQFVLPDFPAVIPDAPPVTYLSTDPGTIDCTPCNISNTSTPFSLSLRRFTSGTAAMMDQLGFQDTDHILYFYYFPIGTFSNLGDQGTSVTLVTGNTGRLITSPVTVPYTLLSVGKAGVGSGLVSSSPVGINCNAKCNSPFASDQTVTLTAIPAAGSIFAGWSGDADCMDGNVTMSTGRSCVARFDLPQANTTLLRGDYDGDGKTDIAVYRPSTGEWFFRLSTQNYAIAAGNWYFQWGVPGDVPISGDFDGDGKSDISVYRPSSGEWYIRLSTQNYAIAAGNWYFRWGIPSDIPVSGDFDGDGKTDIAVYRPSTGEWFIRNSSLNYAIAAGNWLFQWGVPGDQPLGGDFDGDGKTDIAVYRPSTGEWLIRSSSLNYAITAGNWFFQWGVPGDQPVAGDYDGDRKTDIAVYRPSTGEWFIRNSSLNYAITAGNWLFQWGVPEDLPVRGDFDGDLKADLAVYRPSTGEWYFRLSSQGYGVTVGNWYFQWGVPGDLPMRR